MNLAHLVRNPILYLHLLKDFLLTTISWLLGTLSSKYNKPKIPDLLQNRTAIVTGADSAIGLEITKRLVEKRCAVWMGCTSLEKGKEAAAKETKFVHVRHLDMSSMQSIRDFAATWQHVGRRINYLIHAAESTDETQANPTVNGVGTMYAANFLGSFYLTSRLESNLCHSFCDGRVIFLSSPANYLGDLSSVFGSCGVVSTSRPTFLTALANRLTPSSMYANTKLMQIAFASLLQRRWNTHPTLSRGENRIRATVHACAIGRTHTLPYSWNFWTWGYKALYNVTALKVENAVETALWLMTRVDEGMLAQEYGSRYWDAKTPRTTWVDVESPERLERMWDLWEKDGNVSWMK